MADRETEEKLQAWLRELFAPSSQQPVRPARLEQEPVREQERERRQTLSL